MSATRTHGYDSHPILVDFRLSFALIFTGHDSQPMDATRTQRRDATVQTADMYFTAVIECDSQWIDPTTQTSLHDKAYSSATRTRWVRLAPEGGRNSFSACLFKPGSSVPKFISLITEFPSTLYSQALLMC